MIIGLMGKKQAGKDTTAAFLMKKFQFTRKAFADKLKQSVAALFDIPYAKIDEWKNDETIVVGIYRKTEPKTQNWDFPIHHYESIVEMSFREFLQRYGFESHREIFGKDFWVDQCLPVGGYFAGTPIVVTDCRFPNEADRIRYFGGKVIKVERPEPLMGYGDLHISELQTGLEPDYVLRNHGTLEELEASVSRMLDDLSS